MNIEIVEHWREALKKYPITWYNWYDGIIYNLYNANDGGIPLFVLISSDGYIIDKWYGYSDRATN